MLENVAPALAASPALAPRRRLAYATTRGRSFGRSHAGTHPAGTDAAAGGAAGAGAVASGSAVDVEHGSCPPRKKLWIGRWPAGAAGGAIARVECGPVCLRSDEAFSKNRATKKVRRFLGKT